MHATRTVRVRANPGQGVRLREEILIAAEELLVDAGSEDAVTLRAVAQRVGVTTPSLYRHFPDRASLVGAVCLRAWSGLGERMRAAAAEDADPFQALRARGLAYVRFGLDHPVQYRLLLMRPVVSEHSTAEALAAEACYREQVDAVKVCVDAGVLHGDPAVIALTLWATAHGCVSMLIARPPFPKPRDIDGFIDATVRSAGLGSALTTRLPPGTALGAASLSRGLDRLAQDLVRDAQGNDRRPSSRGTGTEGGPDDNRPRGSAVLTAGGDNGSTSPHRRTS